MSNYTAIDDDLPLVFWPEGNGIRRRTESSTNESARAVAVTMHYPEIRIKPRQKQRREASVRSEHEISLTERKVFVKLSKKCQMWDWLCGLFDAEIIGQVRAEQSDAVMQFLTQMYAKFYRYTPYQCKWVTFKQYEWLKHIACQYLKVPNAKQT